jgi:hypothetical protein
MSEMPASDRRHSWADISSLDIEPLPELDPSFDRMDDLDGVAFANERVDASAPPPKGSFRPKSPAKGRRRRTRSMGMGLTRSTLGDIGMVTSPIVRILIGQVLVSAPKEM